MWEIRDETGIIHSGTQEEMQLHWDLMIRSVDDLASKYRRTYTKEQIIEMKEDIDCDWEGDIELTEKATKMMQKINAAYDLLT